MPLRTRESSVSRKPQYLWRKLTLDQRNDLLQSRKQNHHPWHAPSHTAMAHKTQFHLSAACYNHAALIGMSPERMDAFSETLLTTVSPHISTLSAWCVLPNHYHLLITTSNLPKLMLHIGQLHGRTSYDWNSEENTKGRKSFYRCTDRAIRSERHFWACLNYIHHNPVHHGYADRWQDWPWSSASAYLAKLGTEEATRIWHEYPILDFGVSWDPPQR